MRTSLVTGAVVLLAVTMPLFARSTPQTKQLARTQFETAEALRDELDSRLPGQRTRRDYQRVADSFRRVYYTDPGSSKADAAVMAVAELLAEAGRQFNEPQTMRAAIKQYEFLRREYPGSKYRIEALFAIAQIYQFDLNNAVQAKATLQDFLQRYPHSSRADEAKAALTVLDHPTDKKNQPESSTGRQPVLEAASNSNAARTEAAPKSDATPSSTVTAKQDASKPEISKPEAAVSSAVASKPESTSKLLPQLTDIHYWSTPDSTRVAIEVGAEIDYQAGRVPSPERIFFDLHHTKLAPALVGKSYDVEDGFLRKIRVAQYVRGTTRVVLEVEDSTDYSVSLLRNPYRLIIDLHKRRDTGTKVLAGKDKEAEKPTAKDVEKKEADKKESAKDAASKNADKAIAAGKDSTPATRKEPPAVTTSETTGGKPRTATMPAPERRVETAEKPGKNPIAPNAMPTRVADGTTSPLKPSLDEAPRTSVPETVYHPNSASAGASNRTEGSKPSVQAAAKTSATQTTTAAQAGAETGASNTDTSVAANQAAGTTTARLESPDLKSSKLSTAAKADTSSARAPVSEKPAPAKAASVDTQQGKRHTQAGLTAREAQPTASGERSLTRALGLKIGRIVVDAGHGGHDTGTIGPNGLQEKDLVLDVALRLGKLLETKLGADVIYTRDDDTFIPLEARTEIANRSGADLFISIHANSSKDPAARGVETYYLNFTSSADALEVAARENAVSNKSIHELQDLVKKIALKEKTDESREFAADIQKSLWSGEAAKNPGIRNRGVKKAPFIVLIGANMPSVLAEISFLSNPTDERRLQTADYRQKIAEYLYRGITRYANGLSGVKVAQKRGSSSNSQ